MTERHATLQLVDGDFRQLPGKPESHGLIAASSYVFLRGVERWTVYLAEGPVARAERHPA